MRKFASLIAIFVFSLGLSACSEPEETTVVDDNSHRNEKGFAEAAEVPPGVTLSGEVNAHGAQDATGDEIEIHLEDDYFQPTFVKVEANKTYKVKLRNEGKKFHTFTIGSRQIDVQLPPGQNAETQFTAPAVGSVEWVCTPHAGMGMRGAFYVVSPL